MKDSYKVNDEEFKKLNKNEEPNEDEHEDELVEDDDDSQSADPMHPDPPEQKAAGPDFNIRKHGSTGGGES